MRINKYLADNQYCSRREADTLIRDGKVFINGKKASLGDQVQDGDEVTVAGIEQQEKVYYAYFKPKGVVTVNAQEGEKEITDMIEFPAKVYPLGRLDKDSEGLILLTNDGRLTDALLSPTHHHEKEYAVTVDKKITHDFIKQMHQGVRIGKVGNVRNYKTQPAKVRRTSPTSFDIVITEGKNRQIRKMCGAFGYAVKKLRRFRILNIELKGLRPNQFRILKGRELQSFLQRLGIN